MGRLSFCQKEQMKQFYRMHPQVAISYIIESLVNRPESNFMTANYAFVKRSSDVKFCS